MDRLDAYLDGELQGPAEAASVERLLGERPELQRRVELARKLRKRLQSLPAEQAPSELRERVDRLLKTSRRTSAPRRSLQVLSTAVVSLLLCIAGAWLLRSTEDLRPLLVADHIKMVQAEPPSIHTTDPELLEKKLAEQLDFWPALPRWSWAELVSGRPCHLRNMVVARVHYRCEDTDLSLFVLPIEATSREQISAATDWDHRGYRLLTWHEAGLRYVLVVPSTASDVLQHFQAASQG